MTERDVAALVATIQRLWPTSTFTAAVDHDLISTWAIVLADVPFVAAQALLADRSRSGVKFPPAPGEIAHDVLHAIARATGNAAPDADEAWDEVLGMVASRGRYEGPPERWSHPAVAAAVRGIGWTELCNGDPMISRAHFLKMYPTIAARTDGDRRLSETLTALGAAAPGALGVGLVKAIEATDS